MANDAAFGQLFFMGSSTLVKADLGIKRVCPSCGARFYDLQKRPIECPKCAFAFEPEALYKQRRPRQPEPVAAEPVAAESDDEEAEEEETEEAEAETVEPVENESPLPTGSDEDEEEEEVVTEDAEAEGAGMSVVEGDEELEDLAEDVEEDEEDDSLLEEVEEDEDDVSGIIDADIEKDER